jgi:integrase
MKKTQAQRKLRLLLDKMGLNDDAHLERVETTSKTFAEEAAWWKLNRLTMSKPSVQDTMGSHLGKYLLPRFGSMPVTAIDERRAQEFIADLTRTTYKWPNGISKPLSVKTIKNIVGVLRLILGDKVWRDWNLSFPETAIKEQRCFTQNEMMVVVNASKGRWKVLFATLACSGLRCGEIFGLHVEDLDLVAGKIHVRRNIWNGQEVSVKTKNGYRTVNIEPELVSMLTAYLAGRKAGLLFPSNRGTPLSKNNVRRKLHQTLKMLELPLGALHAFRHGRVSMLQANGVPGDLVKEWIGHSSLRTTSRYTHFSDDFRQEVANKVGLFSQPTVAKKLPVGPNGPNFASVGAQAEAAQMM